MTNRMTDEEVNTIGKQQTENYVAMEQFFHPEVALPYLQEGFQLGFRKAESLLLPKLNELESRQEWISVEERLPENGKSILCYTGGLKIVLFYIGGFYYSGDGSIWTSEVTHWQPLPPSPTQNKSEDK